MNPIISCLLTAWLCLFAALPNAEAENRALLVGIGQYADPNKNLPGIDKDIANMKKAVRQIGFGESQIKIVRDADATLKGIEQAMDQWMIQGVTGNDRVLFYFSGHGSQIPDQNQDEKDDADEVLAAHDAKPGTGTLHNTFVDDKFGSLLTRIPAKEIFIFLDACHSGSATRAFRSSMRTRGIVRNVKPKFFLYKGMPSSTKGNYDVVEALSVERYTGLSACRDDEVALATGRGSLFTLGILDAIEETLKKGSNPQMLTMNQLRRMTTDYIALHASKNPFHPQISGNTALAKKNIFLPARVSATSPEPPMTGTQPPEPSPEIWDRLEELVENAAYKVNIRTNQKRFKPGEFLMITCDVPKAGYLNILNVSPGDRKATVLYPNRLHPENDVASPATITIPAPGDRFKLRSTPPLGESLIVAIFTQEKINAYQDGEGDGKAMFKSMSAKGFTRGFGDLFSFIEANVFGAGKVITHIEK